MTANKVSKFNIIKEQCKVNSIAPSNYLSVAMGPKKGKKSKGGSKDDNWGEDNNIEEKLKNLMTNEAADASDQEYKPLRPLASSTRT